MLPHGTLPPMFSELVTARRRVQDGLIAAQSKSALAQRLQHLSADEQQVLVLDLLRTHMATVLGTADPTPSIPDLAFSDHGFDSLTAVEFRNRLKTATGLTLSPTLIFDYPNPAALASYIRSELVGQPSDVPVPAAAPPRAILDEPVAVVGMSCRFPGGVDSPEGLWDLVASGRDVVAEFPADRGWDGRGCLILIPMPRVSPMRAVVVSSMSLGSPTRRARSMRRLPRSSSRLGHNRRTLRIR